MLEFDVIKNITLSEEIVKGLMGSWHEFAALEFAHKETHKGAVIC